MDRVNKIISIFLIVSMLSLSCCSDLSLFKPEKQSKSPIETVQIKGNVSLRHVMKIANEFTVLSLMSSCEVMSDGSFTITAPATEKQQLFMVTHNDKTVLLGYDYGRGDEYAIEISPRTTVLSLVMINPLFFGTSAQQRDEIMAKAEMHPDFSGLVAQIETTLQTDPRNLLDLDSNRDIYESAVHIAVDIIKSGCDLDKDVDQPVLGDWPWTYRCCPKIKDYRGREILFENNTFVYYGAEINYPDGTTQGITTIGCRSKLWKWCWAFPPICTTKPAKTPYPGIQGLADGRYKIFMKKGFDFSDEEIGNLVNWNSANGRGTINNSAKIFLYVLDLVFGISGSKDVSKLKLDLGAAATSFALTQGGDTQDWILFFIELFVGNIDNLIEWALKDADPKDAAAFMKKAGKLIQNVAFVIKVLIIGEAVVNKIVPFFNDFGRSEWTLCHVVNQQGNTSRISGCSGPGPPVVEGPEMGYAGGEYEFYVSAIDPNDDRVACMIDWGDGTQSAWSEFANSGSAFTMNHTYETKGEYSITAQAMDEGGDTSDFSEPYVIEIINFPVHFDIWPAVECPNYFNAKYTGQYITVIYGTDMFDIQNIDLNSVRLEGPGEESSAVPYVWYNMDKAAPYTKEDDCDCAETFPDEIADIMLKFEYEDMRDLIGPIVNGEERMLVITGRLSNGIVFEGRDCLTIIDSE